MRPPGRPKGSWAGNDRIRALLTPAQRSRFEAVLAQRKAMHGSSRDERLLLEPSQP